MSFYACARTSGRRTLLGISQTPSDPQTDDTATGFDDVTVAGRWVGFALIEQGNASGAQHSSWITRVNVRTGRRKDAHHYIDIGADFTSIPALRVTSDGALAWIVQTASAGTVAGTVTAWNKHGLRTFDTGAVSDLRLRGHSLSWTNDGQRKRAVVANAR